ncbi:PREDICTED: aldo-keto reductase AKR2E4-like isoform X2 [Papilio polytes]|uniref:aldo-keto reductase AKR2E4-like isoform X2 n=1 Tax=Papilio polytes TaxID=76194 RepID=UPI000675F4D6|nr:PREDICTED: aldo-keto reductase AKR2E4-like isoform X2 [Papilio polytes]
MPNLCDSSQKQCVYASKNQPPTYQLNDGRHIPSFGLGTWFGVSNTSFNPVDEEASERAVGWAIDAGYRLFDTAFIYGTEKSVGRGVKRKISEGVIKREDVFICTKLWVDSYGRAAVVPALRKSLEALDLDYVDLYLIHFPIGQFANGTLDLTDYRETWQGMVDAKRRGLTHSIGVANFNAHMMDRLIKSSCVKPAVAQIEVNLNIQQPSLLHYCCQHDIAVMGYTPFGSLFPERALPGAPGPRVDDPLLRQIAAAHNKTVPQIVLRYLYDLGVIPIPKSITKSRIEENIDIFDFDLSPEESIALGGYDVNYRSGKIWSDSPYYLTKQFTSK